MTLTAGLLAAANENQTTERREIDKALRLAQWASRCNQVFSGCFELEEKMGRTGQMVV